ncbi:MAG: hypothetical protein ACTTKL_01845 [Treponema sp.]
MKKLFLMLAAAALFSSCDFWNAPVKSWFEEYTENPAVTGASYAGKYETGGDGTVFASSVEDFTVVLTLRNPHGFPFTHQNMTLLLPDELAAAGIDTSPVTIKQDAGDPSKIVVTYPKSFLLLAERGKNISPRVNLRHPKVGVDFGTFEPAKIICNSPPPLPSGARLYKDNSDGTYVVCFNMPQADLMKTGALHADVKEIKINGQAFAVTLNANGTFSVPAALLQAASPSAANSHFVKRNPTDPDFQKTGQPVFFKTNDVENSDRFDYRIEIADEGGRTSKTLISTHSVQLNPPSVTYGGAALSESAVNPLAAEEGKDSVAVRIEPPSAAVNGASVEGAVAVYELWNGHGAVGAPIKSGTVSAPDGSLELLGGDFFLKVYAHKDEYVDSAVKEYKFSVRTQVLFVKGEGASVLTGAASDSNAGSKEFPFATVKKAVAAVQGVSSGAPAVYKIYVDGETTETQRITVGGSADNKSVIIEKLGGAAEAAVSRAAAFTAGALIRLEEGSSLTLKNLTIDGKGVSANDSGIQTAGTLTISGGAVQNCISTGQAGGILVEKGSCTLIDSVVKNCQSSGGKKRGVYVKAYSGGGTQPVFTVKGASQIGSGSDATAVCLGFDVNTGAIVTAADLTDGAHVNLVPENYVNQYGKTVVKSSESAFPAAFIPYFSLTEPPAGYAAFRLMAGTASGTQNALLLRETVTIDGGADENAWAYLKYYAARILPGDDIIVKGAVKAKNGGTVTINGVNEQTDGQIHVGADVTIRGDGAGAELDAIGRDRHFIFDGTGSGRLTLKNLTLKNGQVTTNGGAVLIKADKTLVLENCVIQDCSAGKGGAMYITNGGTFTVKGATVITPLASPGKGKNDVYLENGALITLDGVLTAAKPLMYVTLQSYPTGSSTVQVLSGDIQLGTPQNWTKFEVTPNSGKNYEVDNAGKVKRKP